MKGGGDPLGFMSRGISVSLSATQRVGGCLNVEVVKSFFAPAATIGQCRVVLPVLRTVRWGNVGLYLEPVGWFLATFNREWHGFSESEKNI